MNYGYVASREFIESKVDLGGMYDSISYSGWPEKMALCGKFLKFRKTGAGFEHESSPDGNTWTFHPDFVSLINYQKDFEEF